MDRWQAMRVFVRVAEAGGFAEAARQLSHEPAGRDPGGGGPRSADRGATPDPDDPLGEAHRGGRALPGGLPAPPGGDRGGGGRRGRLLRDALRHPDGDGAGAVRTPLRAAGADRIPGAPRRRLGPGAVPRPRRQHDRGGGRCGRPDRPPRGFRPRGDPGRHRAPGALRRAGLPRPARDSRDGAGPRRPCPDRLGEPGFWESGFWERSRRGRG